MINIRPETDKNKPILVTGGTGLLGSYLLRYLVHLGYTRIRAFARPTSPMHLVEDISGKIEWFKGDLGNVYDIDEAMNGITEVYHTAGLVSFQSKDRNNLMKTNAESVALVVDASMRHNISKLVHVSSVATLSRAKRKNNVSESDIWENDPMVSNYAISKFLGEQEVWRGIAEGLNAAIVNPSIILGSGYWQQGSAELFHTIYKGMPFYTDGVTGYVDVRDVARFMIMLMNSDISGERYVLSAENIPYSQLFKDLARSMNVKAPYIEANKLLRSLAWRAEKMRALFTSAKPIITKETARQAGVRTYYDNAKSLTLEGFSYTPISNTIEETCHQLLESRKSGKDYALLPLN